MKKQRFWVNVVPIVLFAAQALVQIIPNDIESISDSSKLFKPSFVLSGLLTVFLIVLFILNHIFTLGRQYARVNKFDSIRSQYLDLEVGKLIKRIS